MTDIALKAAPARPPLLSLTAPFGVSSLGLLGALAWVLAGAIALRWEDLGDYGRTDLFAAVTFVLAGLGGLASLAGRWLPGLGRRVAHNGPWFLALGLFFALWEGLTAKTSVLPQPFFPPPQALLEVFTDDYPKLGISVLASLKLLVVGYLVGAGTGFVTGVLMGWSQRFGYWGHPILRFLGPLPPTAWLPVAFFIFPTSWSASIFLIALASGFPVTVLTWSGIAGVPKAYYDVARTLGAGSRFQVLRVAIPAAMPHVFVGLFMGMSAAFVVLVIAELLGVKAGLGWYLQWAQGWAAYANMYAALVVMAILCSSLITLLFRARDSLLSWQKGLVKW